jgi:hypothetical protein
MSVSTPVVNAGFKYINGMRLAYVSATTMTVAAGQCRNSTDVNDITIDSAITINTAVNGAAGLDQGSMANDTFYAVYAIADSLKNNAASALISADLSSPLLPGGYNMYFRIGYIKSSGAAAILPFRQDGVSVDRWMWYDAPIATDITNGSSATYAAVDASGGLPSSTATMVNWYCKFTPTAGDDALVLVPGTSTAALGYATMSGSVAAVVKTGNLICPTDSPNTDAIDYKVTGSAVAISVAAYLDQLG